VLAVSTVYASPAVGPMGRPDFLNAAALIETTLDPETVRDRLRQIEADLGRIRQADRYAPRTIDLDLVLFDDRLVNTPPMRIPDPDLLERSYLAVTISELDPEFAHPETGEPLAAIAARLGGAAGLEARRDIALLPGSDTQPAGRSGEAST